MDATDARLTELALRWEELRDRGADASPEQLCADCPELLEPLRRRIVELEAMGAVLDSTGSAQAQIGSGSATRTHEKQPAAVASPLSAHLADFELLGELGHGGMGVVYRAYDRKRRELVALKTMQWLDPAALDRFKREFRAAANLAHPHLVSLHELISDGRIWFFTMELVEGVDFLKYVRSGVGEAIPTTVEYEPHHTATAATSQPEPARVSLPMVGLTPAQVERLRRAVGQLVEGVSALHAEGWLHRDLKPSNVLVRTDGRVALLDFGLVADLGPTGSHQSTDRLVRGTLAYMSPEQAAGHPLTAASDWFSVGVMLYEALTGRRPFGDRGLLGLARPLSDPPSPRTLAPGTPEDLDALCCDLLQESPEARPLGEAIRSRLGLGTGPRTGPGRDRAIGLSEASRLAPLIGRAAHLAFLNGLLDASARGRTVVVRVHGASGVGKSVLVRQLLDDLAGRTDLVVLSGRCYAREAVPYKALDGLIDALARHLRRLESPAVEALLPRDVLSLVRVFPALQRVEAVAAATRRGSDVPDQQELRRRAFAALRELFARLGDRRTLVLAIDDLQWGDLDSVAVMAECLRGVDPPVFLLILCHRDEDVEASPFLREFLALEQRADPSIDWRSLAVEPLNETEALALAASLLGSKASARSRAIAQESGGNPFFVTELVRALEEGKQPEVGKSCSDSMTLEDVLLSRVNDLPEAARLLLEIVAVSGRPLRRADAVHFADLSTAQEHAALVTLTARRLIRGAGAAGAEEIETYHDRVREVVTAWLPEPILRDRHRRLALGLEAAGAADPEWLGAHFRGAGEPERAGAHFAMAADRATAALAFDRAATLYRLALELRPTERTERRSLLRRLGDALANAGRGAEAAQAYLAAADHDDSNDRAATAEVSDLRRLAAMQWLISGHIDEGLSALRDVLAAVGMTLPSTPARTLASLMVHRVRLRLRGLHIDRREPDAIDPSKLARIDACWAATVGLSVVDFIRGADFQARGLLLALRGGDPPRVARALAMEAAHAATNGGAGRNRTARLLQQADTLAREIGDHYALGMVDLAVGTAAYLEGRWRDALLACDQAQKTFRDRCTGVAWELVTTSSFALWSLSHLGEIAELSQRWPVLLQQAAERGDLYAVMNLNTYLMSVVRLAANEPEAAREELCQNASRWSRDGYHVQHNDELWATAQVGLYLGEGQASWDLVTSRWPALSRSMLLRVQFIRIAMTHLRARCALAAAAESPISGPLLRAAERDARALEHEHNAWARALALLIRAGLSAAHRDTATACSYLHDAEKALATVDMNLYAQAAQRCRGHLLGGTEGVGLIRSADAWMHEQGIQDPARMAALYIPGMKYTLA